MDDDGQSPGVPAVTVIIPTHRRPAAMRRCLHALDAQLVPDGGFEVVVVVDGGEDLAAVEEAAGATALDCRVLAQPRSGPSTARNNGAAAARGDWLAFTDDDCRPDPRWLRGLVACLSAPPAALVGGGVRNAVANPFAEASQLLIDVGAEHFGANDDPARFFPSNNLGLSREAFERLGGFDDSFRAAAAEDRDLCDRARQGGLELRSAPDAVVEHDHRLSLRGLWRQHHNYGAGARAFELARARRDLPRLQVAPGYFLAIVGAPFARRRGLCAAVLALAVIETQVAYLSGYAAARWRSRTSA